MEHPADKMRERLHTYIEALENGPYVSLKTQRDILREASAEIFRLNEEVKRVNEIRRGAFLRGYRLAGRNFLKGIEK